MRSNHQPEELKIETPQETDKFIMKTEWKSFRKIDEIKNAFNSDLNGTLRPSIMKPINWTGFSLLTHRLLGTNQIRIVQRNGISEMVTYSGQPQRRTKVWSLWKPWTWFKALRDNSSTVTIADFNQIKQHGHIGFNDRHIIYVEQGKLAKITTNNFAKILEPGVHVIKSNDYKYIDEERQSAPHISHGNCHRLNVPAGKIAAVMIDNMPYLLEGRATPYCFDSGNFSLCRKSDAEPFYESTDPVIKCGSLLRLMPGPNQVAVYRRGNHLEIFPSKEERSGENNHLVFCENNPNIAWERFLQTDNVNTKYPGPDDEKEEHFTATTLDSINVNVKMFISYKIHDPETVVDQLGIGIEEHIKHTARGDVAATIQNLAMNQTQSGSYSRSAVHRENQANSKLEQKDDFPSAPQREISAPEKIFDRLAQDLEELGVTLIRVNIEEVNPTNEIVRIKQIEQCQTVSEAMTRNAALEVEKQIIEKENTIARTKLENDERLATIQKKLVEIKAQADASAIKTIAEAQADGLKKKGEVLRDNPALLALELVKAKTEIFKVTDKIVSPGVLGSIYGSSMSMFQDPDRLKAPHRPGVPSYLQEFKDDSTVSYGN